MVGAPCYGPVEVGLVQLPAPGHNKALHGEGDLAGPQPGGGEAGGSAGAAAAAGWGGLKALTEWS